ncbi:MAG: glycosylhydrolase-like jelly roll fold domain-containing protein [Kiritimatiellia bacterium]
MARFRAIGDVEFWNADDASRRAVPECRTAGDGITEVGLNLAPSESIFVVFRRDGGPRAAPVPRGKVAEVADLSPNWKVSFQPGRGAPAGEIEFAHLSRLDQSADFGIRHFSGTATYRRSIVLDALPGQTWLDLGEVHDVARVFVNGRDCGFAWHTPFRVDVTDAVKAGRNTVEIKVANRWLNRLIGDEHLAVEGKWQPAPGHPETTRLLAEWPEWFIAGKPAPGGRIAFCTCRPFDQTDPLVPSGLVGPVRLLGRWK